MELFGKLPIFSTAIADIQQAIAAADMKLSVVLIPVDITARSESPAPDTSTGLTDKDGKDWLFV